MKTTELRKIIREEVKKTLNEGAITIAMGLGLQGEVKTTVQALETYLKSIDVILDYKNARILAELIIDIIDAAKDEQRNEPSEY
jgi:hypothetical protein